MQGQLKAITISYKNAPLEIRGQIVLNEDETKAMLLKVRDVLAIQEAILLSTCNRTEIYYVAEESFGEELIKLLAIEKGLNSAEILPYFTILDDTHAATNYLFEVAMGLHSQVIGDLQIPNQIKHAYQWSADMQMSGPFMHRLMHTIFFVNKKVVQETAFRDGAASTSYAAIEVIESFLPLLPNPKILVIGVGEIGDDVCRTLADKGYQHITITNRTKSKAETLANDLGFAVADFENVHQEILDSNIIISSILRDEPLITAETLQNDNLYSVKYLIDLSVPRSIDQNVEQVAGVVLYDLDEIQNRANDALEKRKAAIPHVKALIEEAIEEFSNWSKEMVVSPTIQKLKNALEQIRKEEMARYMKTLSEEEAQKVDKITSSMMQKIIKLPVLQLKAACKRGEAETLIDVLNDLFNLETQEV